MSNTHTPADFTDPAQVQIAINNLNNTIAQLQRDSNQNYLTIRTLENDNTAAKEELNTLRSALNNPTSTGKSIREPKVDMPTKFKGDHKKLRDFLSAVETVFDLQPTRFQDQKIKCGFLGTLLDGDALTWFRSIQENPLKKATLFADYSLLKKEITSIFGDAMVKKNAQRELATMSQKGSASSYVANFRRVAADTGYDIDSLIHQFTIGLKPDVQNAIVINDRDYTELDELYAYAIKVDQRLFEQKRSSSNNRNWPRGPPPSNQPSYRPSNLQRQPSFTVRRPSFNQVRRPSYQAHGPTPMEIGSMQFKKLTEDEKQRRIKSNLCLYCGEGGHIAYQCPKKTVRPGQSARGVTTEKSEKSTPSQQQIKENARVHFQS
jgi:hypothetical protein